MNKDWKIPAEQEDPLVRSARREMKIALCLWSAFAAWTIVYAKIFAFEKPAVGESMHLILGMPAWAFWGVILPWGVATLFTLGFALFYMKDHNLEEDEKNRGNKE